MVQQLPARGFLVSLGLPPDKEIRVEFQYNPAQLTDRRAVTYTSLSAPGLLTPVRQYSQGGDRTISFTTRVNGVFRDAGGLVDNGVRIALDEDGSIMPELNKYRAFVYPLTERWREAAASFMPLYDRTQQFAAPPTCLFGFGFGGNGEPTGNDRVVECIVTDVSITEQLFNTRLAPLRAEVSVTLVEVSPYGNLPTPPPGGG